MDVQTEKSFQRQHQLTRGKARLLAIKLTGKEPRYYKSVGLGFKTPREAIEGTFIDRKCPWTGQISIRGRILKGTVISTKMKRTIVVRRNYLHYVPKYNRFEKRHRNIAVHCSPALTVKDGDVVTIGECRPLSKTVRFNVLRIESSAASKKQFAQF